MSDRSLARQVDIPTNMSIFRQVYSDRSIVRLVVIVRQVDSTDKQDGIPTGLYSDRSLVRQVDSPTNRSRQVYIPPGLYSDRFIFRQVVISTGRYFDRSLFHCGIPTGLYSDRSIFRQVISPTNRSRQVYIPTGLYSDRSIF